MIVAKRAIQLSKYRCLYLYYILYTLWHPEHLPGAVRYDMGLTGVLALLENFLEARWPNDRPDFWHM